VKHLVHCQGGRVWATSDPGHGATFYFTLARDLGTPRLPGL
jgi:signal transduction histidine kinase